MSDERVTTSNDEIFFPDSIIDEFEGKCSLRITSDDKTIANPILEDVSFSLKAYFNTKIELTVYGESQLFGENFSLSRLRELSRNNEYFLSGITDNEMKIQIDNLAPISVTNGLNNTASLSMIVKSEIIMWSKEYDNYKAILNEKGKTIVGVANFFFTGTNTSRYEQDYDGGSRVHLTIDHYIANIGEYEVIIKRRREVDSRSEYLMKYNPYLITSEIAICNCEYSSSKEMIDNLLWLVSYSQKSLASRVYSRFEINDNEKLFIIHNQRHYNFSFSRYPIINTDLNDSGETPLHVFLSEVYNDYILYKSQLQLDMYFDLVIQAELSYKPETKFLTLCTTLEHICKRLISELSVPIDRIKHTYKGNITYAGSMQAIRDHLGLSFQDSDINQIKTERNEIVHNGVFKDTDRNNHILYVILAQILLDQILLNLIGYSGDSVFYSQFLEHSVKLGRISMSDYLRLTKL